jgi:hypothetical protein
MRHRLLVLTALVAPLLHGDATLRYHTDVKTAGGLPGAPLASPMFDNMRDMVVRIKGNKAYSMQGNLSSIMDLTTQDMILIDAPNKRFAKVAAAQYTEQIKAAIPAIPAAATAALASMKTSVDSRSTGRTAAIQGIQSEEHEFVMTIDMPAGGPAQAGPMIKMLMQIWTAKPEEAQRVPALQEFRAYSASASASANPAEMVKQLLSALPGMGEGLSAMIAEMSKSGSTSMRMHTEVTMPFLAAMAQQGIPLPPGMDPAKPLMEMNQELVELSTETLDEALFQVPEGYQPATLEEILKSAVAVAQQPRAKQ